MTVQAITVIKPLDFIVTLQNRIVEMNMHRNICLLYTYSLADSQTAVILR